MTTGIEGRNEREKGVPDRNRAYMGKITLIDILDWKGKEIQPKTVAFAMVFGVFGLLRYNADRELLVICMQSSRKRRCALRAA